MIRPELELILCASRVRDDADIQVRLRDLLHHELDWDFLFKAAETHGVLYLLHKRLERCCADWEPRDARRQLRRLYEQNALRNLLLTAELLRLLRLFEDSDVPAIPYKGPALAAFVYGDIALRRTDDLDILVRRCDAWKAREVLVGAGFAPQVTAAQEQMPLLFKSECDLSFVHRRTGLEVEIHWALVPPFYGLPFDSEGLWSRLEHVNLEGTLVPALAREDLLLALCIHGGKHLWERLEWICSLAELTRPCFELDWESLRSRAARLYCQRMLSLGLALARDLLEAELPDREMVHLRSDKALDSLVRQVREHIFSEKPHDLFHVTLFRLRARERTLDRIRYCLVRALTPTYEDMGFLRLKPRLFFLYYLARPFRLGLAFVMRLAKRETKPTTDARRI